MQYKWKKLGVVFDPLHDDDTPDWMYSFAQAPNAVVFENHVRVYFSCRQLPDENNMVVNRCAYVDLDRNDLTRVISIAKKPILELGGLGAFDEFGTYPVSFYKETEQNIIAIHGGWTRAESVPFNISLGLSRSQDGGETFDKFGSGPILSHSPNEPYVVTSPKIRRFNNTWYLSYTAGRKWIYGEDGRAEIIYKLRMATSTDCINWTRLDKDIIPNKLNEDEAQACGDFIYANGVYHMFFCYREGLDFRDNIENTYRIGYASSTNLIDWERDDNKVGIDISDSGWDSEMVAYPNVFELDGKYYMLYGGDGNGRTGFGVAVLEGNL